MGSLHDVEVGWGAPCWSGRHATRTMSNLQCNPTTSHSHNFLIKMAISQWRYLLGGNIYRDTKRDMTALTGTYSYNYTKVIIIYIICSLS